MSRRPVFIVTGSRAEYGLLEPVIRAAAYHPALDPKLIVCGAHLLPPANTVREIEAAWGSAIIARVPMQEAGRHSRVDDAASLGRGIEGLARAMGAATDAWCIVLGDRIEAFAGACAASVGGIALAHIHGGDRAEGIGDEAMRHAITKLAHLHLPATEQSAQRIVRMGEAPEHVHVVGSPAIDALAAIPPAGDELWKSLGAPDTILLFHPVGDSNQEEQGRMRAIGAALAGRRVLWLHPNHDPGREGILAAGEELARRNAWTTRAHLPRSDFIGALRRLSSGGGVIIGNSSAALIECAALCLPAVNLGERQGGRERAGNAVDAPADDSAAINEALARALSLDTSNLAHPYGDGRSGDQIARLLATIDPTDRALLRKRNTY